MTSIQDATESCYYPELVGEPLRLELNFTFPVERVTEITKWGIESFWLQLKQLVLLEKASLKINASFQQLFDRIPQLKYRSWFISLRQCFTS